MNLIDVDELISPMLSLFSFDSFARNDLRDLLCLEKHRVMLLFELERTDVWNR